MTKRPVTKKTKIAIQGEAGSFSHEAARRMVPGCEVVSCARSVEVFDRVQNGSVAAAVIPIENSLAGSVTEHFDLLLARQVFIEKEFLLRIVHNLIAAPGVKRSDLRRAYSHPVALEQCRDFFARNPKIQPTPFYDTAGSVKHVIEDKLRDAAGIAGAQAAKAYKGHISRPASKTTNATSHGSFLSARRGAFFLGRTRLRSLSASKTFQERYSRRSRFLRCATSA